jgi:hypothetical protein
MMTPRAKVAMKVANPLGAKCPRRSFIDISMGSLPKAGSKQRSRTGHKDQTQAEKGAGRPANPPTRIQHAGLVLGRVEKIAHMGWNMMDIDNGAEEQ